MNKINNDLNFENDAKNSISIIANAYNDVHNKTIDEAIELFDKMKIFLVFKMAPRYDWVNTSIFIYQFLRGKTQKKRAQIINKLCEKMNYGKSRMYEFKAMGEKLIKGTFEKLPLTSNEFKSNL